MISFRLRPVLAMVGLLAVIAMAANDADARPGGSKSFGSRGSRTYSAPPPTQTAPTGVRPMDRTATQPGAATAASPGAAAAAASARPGFFNRPGLLGGLAAGFLGAGLLGMLMGNGLLGGLAGFASILGLLLQVALVGGIGWFAWRWWQRRSQPQAAFAGGPQGFQAPQPVNRVDMASSSAAAGGSFMRPAAPAQESTEPSDEIGITGEDYDAFERLLGDIQSAYSAEDTATLRERATPEMFGYLSEELSDHSSRGVVAALSGVKLLQGDLSEAWREGNVDYATVAMRYEIVDQMLDRRTRAVVEGEPKPVEVIELWTFMRGRGGKWMLSGIQQPGEQD
jgi:predicted lipid-binding transport protein (Tim44 family)